MHVRCSGGIRCCAVSLARAVATFAVTGSLALCPAAHGDELLPGAPEPSPQVSDTAAEDDPGVNGEVVLPSTQETASSTPRKIYASKATKRGSWKYKTVRRKGKKHRTKVAYRFKDGSYPTRICKIGKKTYYFSNSHGKLGRGKAHMRLKKVGSERYAVSPDATLKYGWRVVGGNLYRFSGAYGSALKNRTVDSVMLSSTGKAVKTLDEAVKRKAIGILDRITSRNAGKSKRLRAAWRYMVSRSRFTYTIYGFSLNDRAWAKKYANQMFTLKHGDCYGFAACFAALAHEIGYKHVSVVTGRIPGSRDHAADGYTRHGLVRIGPYYFDPEAEYAGFARGQYHKKRYCFHIKSKKLTAWTAFKGTGTPAGISRAFKVRTRFQVAKIGQRYRGYSHGKCLTGLYCIHGKLYRFNRRHYMSAKRFRQVRALVNKGSWQALRKIVGKPKRSKGSKSCYGQGTDYLRLYKHVAITTFAPQDGGAEIVLSARAR